MLQPRPTKRRVNPKRRPKLSQVPSLLTVSVMNPQILSSPPSQATVVNPNRQKVDARIVSQAILARKRRMQKEVTKEVAKVVMERRKVERVKVARVAMVASAAIALLQNDYLAVG